MTFEALFKRRVRGFRLVEVIGSGLLVAIILAVYLGKAVASREELAIYALKKQIANEQNRMRLLQAEAAYFEQPQRLKALSVRLRLAPIRPEREVTIEALRQGVPSARVPTTLGSNDAVSEGW